MNQDVDHDAPEAVDSRDQSVAGEGPERRRGGRSRGITIYPAEESRPTRETGFWQLSDEQLAPIEYEREAYELGSEARMLVADAGGLNLIHGWFKANYPLPRHSHRGDCLYYVISGSAVMGNRTLRAGDAFFVPDNAPYRYTAGPEGVEVLEIRHDIEHSDMTYLEDPEDQRRRVAEALASNREIWEQQTTSPTLAANRAD